MKLPENKKELQLFWGMIIYFTIFLANLLQETGIFRKFLSNNTEFIWIRNENACFNHLNQLVTSSCTLSHFDQNKKNSSFDACLYGS